MQARAHLFKSLLYCLALCAPLYAEAPASAQPGPSSAPQPLLQAGHPVDWWFVFKFNAAAFPACGGTERQCVFGGDVQPYRSGFGQQYLVASSENSELVRGSGCVGDATTDPIGATFDQVYNGSYFYLVWNNQFYDDPKIGGCGGSCGGPWGHSKGVLAWDDSGQGVVLQVTTPSWPAAGNKANPRRSDGNTLGCVKDDNVEASQHFFALKLTKDDVIKVLAGLTNASVVTDPNNLQLVRVGGPADIQDAVRKLGRRSASTTFSHESLSTGVSLISKPSGLHVPPWQMVSAVLGGVPLRTATWWKHPAIGSTDANTPIGWDDTLGNPGAVEIATTGQWDHTPFGLTGDGGPNFNHAKIGISIPPGSSVPYTIFADMNQQGSLAPAIRPCVSSQNGRGGLFYVLKDARLAAGLKVLLTGSTASGDSP
jgi:deoxyribonuclease II